MLFPTNRVLQVLAWDGRETGESAAYAKFRSDGIEAANVFLS
jgi:hypothetical protein